MPSNLSEGQKKFILSVSYFVWTLTVILVNFFIWNKEGILAQRGIGLKILATLLAFPICVLFTMLMGILIQIIVEMFSD